MTKQNGGAVRAARSPEPGAPQPFRQAPQQQALTPEKGPEMAKPAALSQSVGGEAVGDSVTSGLQMMFAAIADEPIPDEFFRLLDAIDAQRNDETAATPGADGPRR